MKAGGWITLVEKLLLTASTLFAILFHLICWCLHPIISADWTVFQRITDFLKERNSILKPLV